MSVTIDLTPWVRGPFTGVGQSALRSFEALRQIHTQVRAISRDRAPRVRDIKKLSWVERALGRSHDIFHSFELHFPRVYRSHTVLTVHDCWTLLRNDWQDPVFQRKQAPRLINAMDQADHIITPTQEVRRLLGEWDDSLLARTSVVPWGPLLLPESHETLDADMPPQIQEFFSSGRPFVLCVACFEWRKNHQILFNAMKGMADLDLVLIGSEGYRANETYKRLDTLVESGVRVLHFNELSQNLLPLFYKKCLALVQPSFEEGFGLPVLEAMSLGKAVLVSEIPVLREVAGGAGIYFDPFSGAEVLRAALKKLLAEPLYREGMERLSTEQAKNFSWQKTATNLRDVYQKLSI